MLELENVKAWYGRTQALFDVSLSAPTGSVLALIGTNGAGKSSTVRAVLGLARTEGAVRMDGVDVSRWEPHRRVREHRIGVVPEAKSLFPGMTVRENLLVGQGRAAVRQLGAAADMFPVIAERMTADVGVLSGGQRQMVALARTFMRQPRLLLLDEPGLGLAPVVVDDIYRQIRAMLSPDLAVVLVEQSIGRVTATADQVRLVSIGRTRAQVAAADREGLLALEREAFGEVPPASDPARGEVPSPPP